ncbi:DUF6328 family protein [Thermomonospora catenispora]|uniref:DUF6328 family protein n=1 Tax=Thermomonospora catenispora TaxID=2493090 RepID=UPI001121C535|nr:DUF6328 family protein [Thermomonospora catenispora]TNY35875.1 hypothetical protein EIO00_16480 [Thermomonospora catenispora]
MTSEGPRLRTASPPETPAERADRNFMELLQGFRVAVTGVQVLFAFLLTVPFAPGFAKVDAADRGLFYVALVSAAVASMLYIAPAAQHRVLFRRGMKEKLVHRANLYGMIGTSALAVSMMAATLLVLDYLFDGVLPVLTAAALAALALWLWFLDPLLRRSRGGGARRIDEGPPGAGAAG